MTSAERKRVAVIGGGPAGLFAAERLAEAGDVDVVVLERRRSVGRTLLLAGRSGLNLTNDAGADAIRSRVADPTGIVHAALDAFTVADLRSWADSLGAETFAGTSGRVFPAAMRGAPLVRAWLARLDALQVERRTDHNWTGWAGDGALTFETAEGRARIEADAVVLALGGASWPRVGSDGSWTTLLSERSVDVVPLRPANCGFVINWSKVLRDRHEGAPVKGVRVTAAGMSATGDLTITAAGLEGTPVYSVAAVYGAENGGGGELMIDLQPDRSHAELVRHLEARRRPKDSMTTWLRRVGLQPVVVDLLRDATGNAIPADVDSLAQLLRALPLAVEGLAPIDRAISSAGGISLAGLSSGFMIDALPGVFAAGEMLDWDAPTGGFLLQTCFSTGNAAAEGVRSWLGDSG